MQEALPRGATLLELRRYNPFDFKTGKSEALHWLALLLTPNNGDGPAPRFIDLGPVADSLPALARLRSGEKRRPRRPAPPCSAPWTKNWQSTKLCTSPPTANWTW